MKPIETPKAQRVADFKRRQLPVVVWSLCALAVAWMLGSRAAQYEYVGLAQAAAELEFRERAGTLRLRPSSVAAKSQVTHQVLGSMVNSSASAT